MFDKVLDQKKKKKKTFPLILTLLFNILTVQTLCTPLTPSTQVHHWSMSCLQAWQDRPWPVLFMLAHRNAIWPVWMITTATAGRPAASGNQGHSTSALHAFPALFPSACRWIIHPAQVGGHKSPAQTLKNCTLSAADIITCNEKVNAPEWAAERTSSQMCPDKSRSGSAWGWEGETAAVTTGSNHDWMRSQSFNWFLTHVAEGVTFNQKPVGNFLQATFSSMCSWQWNKPELFHRLSSLMQVSNIQGHLQLYKQKCKLMILYGFCDRLLKLCIL